MKTHNLVQGTPEWHRHRAQHDNASDAAAMMCASSYKTRDQLLHERATGITPEVNAGTQRLFDSGHRFEALARPLAEAIIGESLYPVTGAQDEGRMSASFDGLTVQDDVVLEHKRLNSRLRAAFAEIKDAVSTGVLIDGVHKTHCAAQLLPKEYQLQMEQQCAVSGCEKVLFMASEWGENDQLIEEHHCWYTPNLELRAAIVAGWAQFHKDLAAYVPPAPVAVISPVAKVRSALPALVFDAKGEVTACNVDEFKAEVLERINSTNMDLITDQDFADGESDAKWLRDVSVGMKTAVQRVRSGMVSVNEVLTVLEQLDKLASDKAIAVEKMVKARKEHLRGEIVAGGVTALRKHIDTLNQSIGRSYVPMVSADFGGAVKGKRSLDSIQGVVNDELARAKIAANEVATRIQHNLKTLHDAPGVNLALFPDVATIVLKACDDFAALVQARMAQHQAAEKQRMDAERERIRGEEAAKASAAAADLARQLHEQAAAQQQAAAAIAQAAAPVQAQAVAAPVRDDDYGERINLGTINEHLAPIKLNAAGLAALGFEPAATVKASRLYRVSDLPAIRAALIEHLVNLPELQTA